VLSVGKRSWRWHLVRKALQADIAVSVSGIAGPGGGLPNKPVGTTWIGLSALTARVRLHADSWATDVRTRG
jgi:nicotinamide mononucleotide (NMN) deamidase PncC